MIPYSSVIQYYYARQQQNETDKTGRTNKYLCEVGDGDPPRVQLTIINNVPVMEEKQKFGAVTKGSESGNQGVRIEQCRQALSGQTERPGLKQYFILNTLKDLV